MRKFILPILILVIGLVVFLPFLTRGEETDYSNFYSSLQENNVETVTIDKDVISYTLKESKTKYTTMNPSSPTLKEELLKSGIKVKDNTSTTLDDIINTIFNIIFLFIIVGALYALFNYSHKTFRVVKNSGINFSNIAGMEEEKKELLSVVSMMKNNQKSIKGIILEGPPGNGKTLFARALSTECKINFIATRGADFQGALMGLGAFKVKMLFNKARRNRPCIIFIDEFDSIGEKRNYNGSGIDKENNRILTTLLNEMDGFKSESRILVIAATNSYESLDPALVRPGRFDLKFTISNPDVETRKELIEMYLSSFALAEPLSVEFLSSLFAGFSCASIETIIREAIIISKRNGKDRISKEELSEASKKTALPLRGKGL